MSRVFLWVVAFFVAWGSASAQNDYFFGDNEPFDSKIPTPEEFLGFPVGTSLVRYDKLVAYYRLLDRLSDRAELEVIGRTYEDREYVILKVSSAENIKNLEQIRQRHLELVDPGNSGERLDDQKVIVQLGYNVHGGELAGTDAALMAAYYFVASVNPETEKRLDEVVLLIEPALNPDGRDRATSYFNSFHSFPPVADPNDIEHAGGFVPHRGNHFWADLNRDWFPLVHVESRARAEFYHKWYPNIYADYHEMGSNSSYYFEPSPPRGTWNPTIPEETYSRLNPLLAKYYAAALDRLGSLYFTKENFDNISPIYGSTYPDFQGGVGTTLEIGSSSGVEIETRTGIRTFARNIRDNVATSIAALQVAVEGKEILLRHQKDFFRSALTLAAKEKNRYIVFGDEADKGLTNLFLDHLLRHHIQVYELSQDLSADGRQYKAGSAYAIPLGQPQYRILNAVFEENTHFVDSIFMDITAWSTAHGYGIPFSRLKGEVSKGAVVEQVPVSAPAAPTRSEYAYIFDYTDYWAPKALYYLLDQGIVAKAAYKEFTVHTPAGDRTFHKGAIVVPVAYQTRSADEVFQEVYEASSLAGIEVTSVSTGASVDGIDLGSDNIRKVDKPVVATLVGDGINWTNVGEAWFLLGNRLDIPLTKIKATAVERTDLSRYTTLLLTDGDYSSLSDRSVERLKAWVAAGGVLITAQRASQWAIDRGIVTGFLPDSVRKASDAPERLDYIARRGQEGPKRIGGALFEADLDITNPLAFGFLSRHFYQIKAGNYRLPRPADPYATLLQLKDAPRIGGYVTRANEESLRNAPMIVFGNRGKGTVVLFGESPTFRGYWLSTGRLLTNAIFFGKEVSLSGRYRP